MNHVPFYDVEITGGFWDERQKTVSKTTVNAVYDRFDDTGRIKTLDCKKHDVKPHVFWGSDVFKWVEGAAYILEKEKNDKLLKKINDIVDMIESGMREDGYYNSYYNNTEISDEIYTDRNNHELYSAGHMFEAGVALSHATGDTKLLELCCRNADEIYKVFVEDKSALFITPGHEEIELALVKLYDATGNKKYLELSEFFVRQRGDNEEDELNCKKISGIYSQSHLPVTQQKEAVGHAVRAVYLYCAIADLADKLNCKELEQTAKTLFDDIYEHKMYITGGIGAQPNGEAFSTAYHLPNNTAYAETCAALGLALFGRRLYKMTADGRYGDAVERAIYNGMISGLSLEGDAFFYVNPLEIDTDRLEIPRGFIPATKRKAVFSCSCCPPNIVRIVPSIGDFIYTYDDKCMYIHQYIANTAATAAGDVKIETEYPLNGKVHVTYTGGRTLALRKPAWCQKVITDCKYTESLGYMYFDETDITLEFEMKPTFYTSSSYVHENTGRVALMRGPIVYCIESKDQPDRVFNLTVDPEAELVVTDEFMGAYPIIKAEGFVEKTSKSLYSVYQKPDMQSVTLKFIPYYTFANRGEDDMQVWVRKS